MKNKRIASLIICFLMLFNLSAVSMAEKAMGAAIYWADSFVGAEWNTVNSDTSVFNIADFEPGEESIKYFKVENSGDKAFLYTVNFTGSVDALAEKIDVYVKNDVNANVAVADMTRLGTLAEVTAGVSISEGKLLPDGLTGDGFKTKDSYIAVALKMHEGLGNEYQGLSIGEGFNIVLTATECDYNNYPSTDKFALVFENTDEYLYRVGNVNTVALGSLFKAVDGAEIGDISVTIESLDSEMNASGTYTKNTTDWTLGTIKFSGNGPVKVTISDTEKYGNATPLSLNLEVVDATNVMAYSELSNKNSVLLKDITMTENGSKAFSNVTVYGNGFTLDVTNGKTSGENMSANYLVSLNNAHLDNIKIVGKVYTEYGATTSSNYNRPVVLTQGNSTIKNSYISNCASPVRVYKGSLEIKNTTLKGGNFANLDIRNGNVILDNVTTINQVNANDTATDGTIVVGLGVVVYYEGVLASTTVEIKNGITQYNNLSKSQADKYITDDTASGLATKMYNSSYSNIQYNDGTEKWVNTGILSMSADTVGDANITDVDGYESANPTAFSVNGYVHTKIPTAENIKVIPTVWEAEGYGEIAPKYSFDHTSKNYQAQADGSDEYCYYSNDMDKVLISFIQGGSKEYDLDILTATKFGKNLDYSVAVDGTVDEDKKITFDKAGDYMVEYTYTDPYNFSVDTNGNVVKNSMTYTKTLNISVTEVALAAKNATFSFYGYSEISTTPAETITDVVTKTSNSGKTYIMPAATSTNVKSTTIDGITVNCPVVHVDFKDNSSDFNWLYPVFLGVKIVDYADGGTGAETTVVDKTSTSKPANITIITTDGTWSAGSGATGSEGKITSGTYKGLYGWTGGALGSDKTASSMTGQFSYQDNKGTVYYYCIRFERAEHKCPSCLTEDTLITLADGSQKRIDELTFDDELLVWDFFKGEYTTSKLSLLINDGEKEYEVITLNFDDGSELRIIYEHGLFGIKENDYVLINKENVADYIGHSFIKNNGMENAEVVLESYEITKENIGCYTILTAQYNNCIANGLLTVTPPPIEHFYDYFEIGEGMKYDEILMQSDIEKYGLYTYDDFKDYISYEEFVAFNGQYLKILVGKGYITFDDILEQISEFGVGSEVQETEAYIVNEDADENVQVVLLNTVDTAEVTETTVVITSGKNTVSTATYSVSFTRNENVITLTATGNASNGYAEITLDGDTYCVGDIKPGESLNITVQNFEVAKDKNISITSGWGSKATTITDNIIDLGEFKVIAERSENGVLVTLSNTTKYDLTGDVYVAVYNCGRLLNINKANVTAVNKSNTIHTVETVLPENGEVKVFLWETNTMKPMIIPISFDTIILPDCRVTNITGQEITATGGVKHTLLKGASFETTETADIAEAKVYADYNMDFVITFDKDVDPNKVKLAGFYESWCNDNNDGNWVIISMGEDTIPANTPIRVMELLSGNPVTYMDVVNFVEKFDCGIVTEDEVAETLGVTVELKLYEVINGVETGKVYTIAIVK